jgi:capsular polysaccharide biosynthesis protein
VERRSILEIERVCDTKAGFLKSQSDALWRAEETVSVHVRPVRNVWAESGTRNEAALKRSLTETEYAAPPLVFGRFHGCIAEPASIRLVSGDGDLISETASVHDLLDPNYRSSNHLLRRGGVTRRLRKAFRAIDEDVLFAVNSFCASYGHFVLTTLPIVFSFLDEIRKGSLKVVIPAGTPGWMISILCEIGITEDAFLRLPDRAYRFRSAIVSNILDASNTRAPNPASLRWTEDFAVREPTIPHSANRIYVKRSEAGNLSSRTISTEPDLIRAIASNGFAIVEPGTMSLAEQIQAFRQANVVVSAHGSSFANLIFCRPGTKVLDLMPDSWVGVRGDSLRDVWVSRLCAATRLDYSVLLSPSTILGIHETGNPTIVYDVSPSDLSKYIDAL